MIDTVLDGVDDTAQDVIWMLARCLVESMGDVEIGSWSEAQVKAATKLNTAGIILFKRADWTPDEVQAGAKATHHVSFTDRAFRMAAAVMRRRAEDHTPTIVYQAPGENVVRLTTRR